MTVFQSESHARGPSGTLPSGTLTLGDQELRLLELVQTPVLILDDSEVRYANAALCGFFDATPEDFIGGLVNTVLPDRALAQYVAWKKSEDFRAGRSLGMDVHLIGPLSRRRWMNARFTSCLYVGKPAAVAFLMDIEDRKKTRDVEAQLLHAQKMEAVGRLAGGVAHDMNNLLGAIMGFASVMQSDLPADDTAIQDLQHILSACRKGRDLTRNLLGFAQRGKYRTEIFAVESCINDVIDLLKHSIPKKIRIRQSIKRPDIQIHGDATQIHQALMNLCLNAVDSMGDQGTLTIECDTATIRSSDLADPSLDGLEPGRYARLSVSDTGSGMPAEVMDMAFEPFFTTKPLGQGSGLGLSMVYGTVKNHAGAVQLKSRPNHGTEVTLLLPLLSGRLSTPAPAIERRTPSDLQMATILLVDDEAMIREAGSRILAKLGYGVITAGDGREGLRLFVENRAEIAAVMLDLMMPIMDGEETLRKIKEIHPEVPVLLSSGYSKEEKAEQLIALGAGGFIQKPFDMSTLKHQIERLLDRD